MYLILTSQTSTRGPIVGHTAQNIDAQQVFINTSENIINRRAIFQKTYKGFKRLCNMPGVRLITLSVSQKVKNYNNEILVSSPSFSIGTNLKVNLNGEKDKTDVNPKKNLTLNPIKSTNKMLRSILMVKRIKQMSSQKRNLTSSPIKSTNKMLR